MTFENFHYHYYIIDNNRVIGRFDVCGDSMSCGFTYHIKGEFQNRGIGQTALNFIVDRIFEEGIPKITILAVNERSAAIALKCGFTQKSSRRFELRKIDYQPLNPSSSYGHINK